MKSTTSSSSQNGSKEGCFVVDFFGTKTSSMFYLHLVDIFVWWNVVKYTRDGSYGPTGQAWFHFFRRFFENCFFVFDELLWFGKKNSSTTNTSMEILTNGYWNVVKHISCKLMIFWSISLYSSKIVWLHSSQEWRRLRTSLPSFTFQSLFSTQGQPMSCATSLGLIKLNK